MVGSNSRSTLQSHTHSCLGMFFVQNCVVSNLFTNLCIALEGTMCQRTLFEHNEQNCFSSNFITKKCHFKTNLVKIQTLYRCSVDPLKVAS